MAHARPQLRPVPTELILNAPEGVTVTPAGDVVVANTGGGRLVVFSGTTGQVTGFVNATFIGTAPADVDAVGDGSLLVADRAGRRILRVQAPACNGGGDRDHRGRQRPARRHRRRRPRHRRGDRHARERLLHHHHRLPRGRLANGRVRRVDGATISTPLAGLAGPTGVTSTGGGEFLVAEEAGNRVRRLALGGAVTPRPATAWPAPSRPGRHDRLTGGFLVAERTGHQVRRVLDATPDPVTPVRRLPVGPPVLRRTAVVERVRGIVSVRPRGKRNFVRLTDPALVRLGPRSTSSAVSPG